MFEVCFAWLATRQGGCTAVCIRTGSIDDFPYHRPVAAGDGFTRAWSRCEFLEIVGVVLL